MTFNAGHFLEVFDAEGGDRSRLKILGPGINPACFLATHGVVEHGDPMPPCDGRLVRCHLIRAQKLPESLRQDRRGWVLGCGGPMGNTGHHGMLDHSRTLRLARTALPGCVEELALEAGLMWWLDLVYGERP